jgi:broad specificity phosphatase PhoE
MVVAHNAVNQALIGSALGLPPRYFRRLLQVWLQLLQLCSYEVWPIKLLMGKLQLSCGMWWFVVVLAA